MKDFWKIFFMKLKNNLISAIYYSIFIIVFVIGWVTLVILFQSFGFLGLPLLIIIAILVMTLIDSIEETLKNRRGR